VVQLLYLRHFVHDVFRRTPGEAAVSPATTKGATMLRRVAVLAVGLAMTTSVALAGAASAATPAALHIKAGSKWAADVYGTCEEVVTFAANHTFRADKGDDSGTWSSGYERITMSWTEGSDKGEGFSGSFPPPPPKEYLGIFAGLPGGVTEPGELVKGAVPGC
jgi:hypothetical protein